jgi:hypothetical protein
MDEHAMQTVKRQAVRTTLGEETGFIIEINNSNACEGKGGKRSIRTLERAGKIHEAISAEVICEAACRVVGCEDCGCSEGKPCGPKCGC